MEQFTVGRTYSTRSICNHDCIINVRVIRRTAKTVTAVVGRDKEAKVFRPYVYRDEEHLRPWGTYSMAPIVSASDRDLSGGAL